MTQMVLAPTHHTTPIQIKVTIRRLAGQLSQVPPSQQCSDRKTRLFLRLAQPEHTDFPPSQRLRTNLPTHCWARRIHSLVYSSPPLALVLVRVIPPPHVSEH